MIEENNQDSGYDSPESQEIQPEKSDSQKTNDENLCIICCDQERSLVFIPCGHLVSCGRCAVNFTTCPTCRSDITGSAKVRFSQMDFFFKILLLRVPYFVCRAAGMSEILVGTSYCVGQNLLLSLQGPPIKDVSPNFRFLGYPPSPCLLKSTKQ